MTETAPVQSAAPAQSASPGAGRMMSLDVFRGATIAGMMLVNNPGTWDATYAQLEHAEWHGWTFTDLIFPFFVWIVGVAIPLSTARRLEQGQTRHQHLLHALRRSLIIFALGFFLNSFSFFVDGTLFRDGLAGWFHNYATTVRIPGVLQRIAICYLATTFIFLRTGVRGQVISVALLLAGYWLLMTAGPWLGLGTPGYEKGANFAQFVAGNLLLFMGLVLGIWLPINKSLWTSSYAVFMAGMALNCFGVCYWLIDVQGWRRWAKPFAIYGMNAITVFVLAGILGRLGLAIKVTESTGKAVALQPFLYQKFFAPLAAPKNASLIWALMCVALLYLVAYAMYRRKWFIRF